MAQDFEDTNDTVIDPDDLLVEAKEALSTSDEAAHLLADKNPQLMETSDAQEATESGVPWTPPDSPTPEGAEGTS